LIGDGTPGRRKTAPPTPTRRHPEQGTSASPPRVPGASTTLDASTTRPAHHGEWEWPLQVSHQWVPPTANSGGPGPGSPYPPSIVRLRPMDKGVAVLAQQHMYVLLCQYKLRLTKRLVFRLSVFNGRSSTPLRCVCPRRGRGISATATCHQRKRIR
jgi:hypothetical protein